MTNTSSDIIGGPARPGPTVPGPHIIVCGSRHWHNQALIDAVLDTIEPITIIEGECTGADRQALIYAQNVGIPVKAFPADWSQYGYSAGPIRNTSMLRYLQTLTGERLVIAFHNDLEHSKGTGNMVKQAIKANIPVIVVSDGDV